MIAACATSVEDKADATLTALEEAVLGNGLPDEVSALLYAAAQAYRNDARAEALLERAQVLAPDHAAVFIALYRFYFYKGRLAEALAVAERCLVKALGDLGLERDWRMLRAQDARFGDYRAILPRFAMFTLKGYAYLHMRLGHLDEARIAIDKLLELDPHDKIGATVLRGVLQRQERGDDDE
jgi:tetratricopeptide (TPR) repeat protein